MTNKIYLCKEIRYSPKEETSPLLERAVRLFSEKTGFSGKVIKLPSGKPVFESGGKFVSVTHTDKLYIAGFSDIPFGIDAEKKGTEKKTVAERFYSEEEKMIDFSYVWCSKEAVSKISGEGLGEISKISVRRGEAEKIGEKYNLYEVNIPDYTVILASPEKISGVEWL